MLVRDLFPLVAKSTDPRLFPAPVRLRNQFDIYPSTKHRNMCQKSCTLAGCNFFPDLVSHWKNETR